MKTVSVDAQAAMAAGAVRMALLVLIEFPAGDVALNTSNYPLVWDGTTYQGAYGLGSIAPVRDSAGQVQGLQFELAATSTATVTLALDGSDQWQGAPVTLRVAVISDSSLTVLDAPVEWAGYGDVFTLRETDQGAVVVASAESAQIDMLRGTPLTYSHADQQSLVPGDRFFEFVTAQADKPVVWPSKEWFYK